MSSNSVSALTGRAADHLCAAPVAERIGAPVHAEVAPAYERLRDDARQAGFELRILSGFRSFDRQLAIWNAKARGERPVLDSLANPLDLARLSPRELVFAILRWSALPGASRHHWGTDLDVYDAGAMPDGYDIALVPEEVDEGGIFASLHAWLDERIADGTSRGFFRPYDRDRGGVAPERWHLSHAPVAAGFERALRIEVLQATLASADLALQDTVLEHLDEIYERFVINTGRPAA